eukprot:2075709-Rhodomonas_salina.1
MSWCRVPRAGSHRVSAPSPALSLPGLASSPHPSCYPSQIPSFARSNPHFHPTLLEFSFHPAPSLSSFPFLFQDSSDPLIVDFFTTWCGPCRLLEPQVSLLRASPCPANLAAVYAQSALPFMAAASFYGRSADIYADSAAIAARPQASLALLFPCQR